MAHEVVAGRAERGWVLRRCRVCGSAMLAAPGERNASWELHETGTYAPWEGRADPLLRPLRALADRERVRLLGSLPPAARAIDLGAGRGGLVAALRARGHDAVGIEPASVSSQVALDRGLPVERVTLEEASFPAREADLVILWHVVEHLDDPAAGLERARRWLKPEGRLVVAVPNLGSLQARIGDDRWFHQDVPRHRTHFTVTGLDALLRRCGFVPARARHLTIEQNWLGMWLTLLNRLTFDRDVPFRFAKGDLAYQGWPNAAWDAFASVLAGIPLIPVAATLEVAAGLARRGGTVVVHASPG